jgi:hypothetical protein
MPIISRVKSVMSSNGSPKGEICYAKDNEAVWFKGKRFTPNVWANTPGEQQIKQLKPAIDSKGRKVGEEWFATVKVENALNRYWLTVLQPDSTNASDVGEKQMLHISCANAITWLTLHGWVIIRKLPLYWISTIYNRKCHSMLLKYVRF